jgi:hypothetical protein
MTYHYRADAGLDARPGSRIDPARMIRAFQWDLARQAERLDWLLAQLPRYASWGYQELYLHLEDAVEYPSLPGVARADAYTYREFATLVGAAERAGIKVVPIVNLLGHTQYLVKVPGLRDLNELRAPDGSPLAHGQICPLHPRTLEVAEKLLRDMAPFCTAGKVHVGLDESFHLGRHPLSRAEIARHGLAAHFAGYAGRLHALAAGLGLRMGLWADMLYYIPEAIPLLPRGVIAYDWYYYPFSRHPRVELFNFAERDLAAPLRRRGIEYWGCPMNGAFRHEPLPVFGERLANIRAWWDRCRRVGAGGMLVTSWEASRLALELTTVVDAAAAGLWLEPRIDNNVELLARGFERVFSKAGRVIPDTPVGRGRSQTRRVRDPAFAQGYGGHRNPPGLRNARELARMALSADERAFSGYARWEINTRWDTCAGRAGPGPYERDLKFFDRQLQPARILPAPLAASLRFRRYLAARDVFVRKNARAVFQLRRWLAKGSAGLRKTGPALVFLQVEADEFAAALRAGRLAARAMWARTRNRAVRGPNELLLTADAERLQAWRRWLARVRRQPSLIRKATPVCGAWQLQFMVHNFAPALQKVIVEQQRPDGSWEELHGRFTIEFRAAAARPRTGIQREFSVPVDSPSSSLRIAVRGIGRVKIGRVALTDGVTRLSPRGWPPARVKVIGRPAPHRGFPELQLMKNQGELPLAFRPPQAS